MQERCHVCQSSHRLQIDRALVQGRSKASISREFGISEQSLTNHEKKHLSHQLATAWEKKEMDENFSLLGRIDKILVRAEKIYKRNYEQGKDGTALKALSEQRSTIELLARISAYLHQTKLLELEMERERQRHMGGLLDEDKLDVLTAAEFDMLERLAIKVENQSSEIIIEDEPEFTMPEPRRVRTKRSENEIVEDELDESEPGEETVAPSLPKPRPIPGGDIRWWRRR